MKRIILLLLVAVSLNLSAQISGTTYFAKTLELNSVPLSISKADSVMVLNGKIVKHVPRSEFGGGGSGEIKIVNTNITSANLITQDIAGFVSYINALPSSFAVAKSEIQYYTLTDTGKQFMIKLNGRSFGGTEADIVATDVISQDKVILNTPFEAAKTIVFRGDSLMTGQGITATDRWPKVLCDAMGYTESNLAVSGTTAKTTPLSLTPTKTSSMKYLVFGYGTNDRALGGNTATIFETDLTNLVNDAISKGWSGSDIILVSLPGFHYQGGSGVASILSYNTAISNVATAKGCTYVDLWYSMVTNTPFGNVTNSALTYDGTHPNKTGCEDMAKIVMPAINYYYQNSNQVVAVKGLSEFTDIKFSKYNYSATGTLLGISNSGATTRLLGLPDGIIAQGGMFVNKGIKQTTAYVPSTVTDMDFVLKGQSKIFSANDNSNYAEIELYDTSTGYSNFRSRYNNGGFRFYTNTTQLLALDIQASGFIKPTYGITIPYGTAYIDQSVSATLYGRLHLYDSSGDTALRNSFVSGKLKTFMSGGTSGNQVQVKQMFASGREVLQSGGTFTEVASARFAINSNTEGFLPPRMTTTEKNAIASPAEGLIVYDSTLKKLCVYNGTAWETIQSL
ncbi:hypothetical protein GJU43_14100 [Flavobacterium sp. LC2016-23]|uniref:SGNH/GDSL hydrolase family protein n=1 Tax=Flavobacterium sp. LC2016-23 TaxID=2666330 RepID=UPI0012B046FB|nr:SGNH/GDSL hydrolase family protein [Flavobacterium sp. LC2016-23]MRX40416.1 hypothetical protein [Flavobacterium sp. LC2016-23]